MLAERPQEHAKLTFLARKPSESANTQETYLDSLERPMKLAIVHYHLNRGGVSRVIQSHLKALETQVSSGDELPVVVFYGGRNEGWPEDFPERLQAVRLTLHKVPLLDYDQVHRRTRPALDQMLYEQLFEALQQEGCSPEQTLLHVHNHALGKNVALPGVLVRLAELGYPLLLQIHDFAEDFRPSNYRGFFQSGPARPNWDWPELLYPQAEHIHYAVLNTRDQEVLLRAGLEPSRVHLLANPVIVPGALPSSEVARARLQERVGIPSGDRYLLYPVRAIRRKNVGEAILYSLLAEEKSWVGITLAPLNPAERSRYQGWRQFTYERQLPCTWETGERGGLSLPENMAAADALISTSLTEGFGMAFLESWAVGRPLVGRNLPEITQDFVRQGLQLPWMWDRVAVPVEWLGKPRVAERMLEAYRQVLAAYQRPMQANWAEALEEKLAGGCVDFGDLDEVFQQEILEKILSNPCFPRTPKAQILEKNPPLGSALAVRREDGEEVLSANAQVVAEHFAAAAVGQRLWNCYLMVAQARRNSPLQGLPHPERILESFLDLRRFRMLRA